MTLENTGLLAAMEKRRSIRVLKPAPDFDYGLVERILKKAMLVHSAFNMQSYRILHLKGQENDRLWDMVEDALFKKIGAEKFEKTRMKDKISGFRNGNGTLLFFEDEDVVEEKGNIAKSYKETFPKWSQQGSGIIQYAIWLMLTAEGLSASLQHYDNLIIDTVRATWNIPENWALISQMPYGIANEEPGEREFIPFGQMTRFEG